MLEHESQQSQELSTETREKIENLHSLQLFVIRHGKTAYRERAHVIKTGKWNPNLKDLTQEGEEDLDRTVVEIADQLDPEKNIIVFFSSPRARALRSQEHLAKRLKEKGFEIFEQEDTKMEMLRSGGDTAPLIGKENSVWFIDGKKPDDYDVAEEDLQATYGVRFRQFLSYFSAIDKKKLLESINDPEGKFHRKVPVYIAVTHGEVTHAGINPEDQYTASFLGTAFPEYDRMKLFRGKAMKLDFDLDDPGAFTLSLSSEMSPLQKDEEKKLRLDQKTGTLTLVEQKVLRQ